MRDSSARFEKGTLLGVLSVLTFGLTALFAVVGLEFLVPTTFVLGFFILVPLVALLGDSLPMVRSEGETEAESVRVEQSDDGDGPVEELRARYARGELTDAEFERQLERLLETENVEAGDRRERVFDRE